MPLMIFDRPSNRHKPAEQTNLPLAVLEHAPQIRSHDFGQQMKPPDCRISIVPLMVM
jgi:hypothetical protein